jgi:hypothetical protein
MALPGQFQVGQLYKGGKINGLPVWTQPGGQGGLVYPQLPQKFPAINTGFPQAVMSYPSLYVFGCGHPLNCPEIFEVYDPYGEQDVALVCCPMCSFIQQVIEPYADYTNYEDTPIVVA